MSGPRILAVQPQSWTESSLEPARAWIASARIVAFPTDTYYGLAVDPRAPSGVAALFDVKGRGASFAIPLIASSMDEVVGAFGPMTAATRRLARRFWPGPLSLILDASPDLAIAVHGGQGSVAVRVPDNAIARTLARLAGGLVTATSANRSGYPPAKSASDLGDLSFDERLFVIDAGPTPGGHASTIVDARNGVPRLVREGAIAWNRVLESLHE